MTLTIKINLDNAAFEGDPSPEVKRIVEKFLPNLASQESAWKLRDIDGNVCGLATLDEGDALDVSTEAARVMGWRERKGGP